MSTKCPSPKSTPRHFLPLLIALIVFTLVLADEDFCYTESECPQKSNSKIDRYILYDVNPPEGFNLRRDVYMRFAILAHKLRKSKNERLENFKLVLPPWSHLYHWRRSPQPEQIPWGLYFDLDSLKSFAPVIEMHEFFHVEAIPNLIDANHVVEIDEVYVLQHYEDMFETGNFENRMSIENCQGKPQISYFFYKNVTSSSVKCLSYHGPATKLSQLLEQTPAKTILFHHAEVALHEMFGDKLYWQCRRSMRFNKHLRDIAATFRRQFLNSTDEEDKTEIPPKWEDEKETRNAKGGPFLGVHLRRKDFLRGRTHKAPSLESVAKQIVEHLGELNLSQVFIATDAADNEYGEILQFIPPKFKVMKYVPSDEVRERFHDGGIAIIEQIICAHARHFIGTHESTFSFRIQEEREILGFPAKTTFNSFCGSESCPQPSVWKIVH